MDADDVGGEPLSFVDHEAPDPSDGRTSAASTPADSTAAGGAIASGAAEEAPDAPDVPDVPKAPDVPYVRIERSVVDAVRADVAAGPAERGGLLLGWYDEQSDTVSITGSWVMERGQRPGPFTPPAYVWESAIDAADEAVAATGEGGGIVGWYRGSALGGVWMPPEAVEVQNERFGDRSLVAMAVDPPTGEIGFFAGSGMVPTRVVDWEVWSIEASRHAGLPATRPVDAGTEPFVDGDAQGRDRAEPGTATSHTRGATQPAHGLLRRNRAWMVAAVAAVAGLLIGLFVSPDGGGGDDGANRAVSAEQVARDLAFLPTGAPAATGRTGTVITFATALRWAGDRRPIVTLTWTAADLGGTVTPAPTEDQPGRYVVKVTPDVKLPTGTYEGAVVARRCAGGTASCGAAKRETVRQPFTIQVDTGSTVAVPTGLAIPDPSRMAGDGQLRSVPDELVITLDVGSDTADSTALELARGTGATVIGGDRAGRVYQLRYADTAARDAAISTLNDDGRVSDVTLDRDLGSAPPDATSATAPWHLDALGGGLPFAGRRPPARLAVVGTGASLEIPALRDTGIAGAVSPPATVGLGTYSAGVACWPGSSGGGILSSCTVSSIDVGSTPPSSSLAALYSGVVAAGNTQAPVVLLALDADGGALCGSAEPAAGDPRVKGFVSVLSRGMQVVDDQASTQGRSVLWVLPAGDGCYSGPNTVSAGLAGAGLDNLAVVTAVDQVGALSAKADAGNHIPFAAPGGVNGDGHGIPGPVASLRKGDRSGSVPAAAMAAGLFAEARAGGPDRSAADVLTCVRDGIGGTPPPSMPAGPSRNIVGFDQLRDTHLLSTAAIRSCAVP